MFAYLKGKLVSSTPSQAVVDVNGVGYLIFIPCSVLGQLPHLGELVQFHTSYVVREFSQALYGFLDAQERNVFEILMNVTGVGPKLALSLIGHLPPFQLHGAIQQQDLPALCRVPGVGKKTAERLVVELKDKLAQFLALNPASLAVQMKDPRLQQIQDATLALINLGYTQHLAQKAIKQSLKELPEDYDLATLITSALKNI